MISRSGSILHLLALIAASGIMAWQAMYKDRMMLVVVPLLLVVVPLLAVAYVLISSYQKNLNKPDKV